MQGGLFLGSLRLLVALAPLFLTMVFLLISIIGENLKGIFYLSGILLGSLVWKFFSFLLARKEQPGYNSDSAQCSIFLFGAYPSYNAYYIAFTMIYILLPMSHSGNYNWALIVFFALMQGLDLYYYHASKCSSNSLGSILGIMIGLVCGGIWYQIMASTSKDAVFFSNSNSDKEYCSRPGKKQFKCKVYKKGVLVSSF